MSILNSIYATILFALSVHSLLHVDIYQDMVREYEKHPIAIHQVKKPV